MFIVIGWYFYFSKIKDCFINHFDYQTMDHLIGQIFT